MGKVIYRCIGDMPGSGIFKGGLYELVKVDNGKAILRYQYGGEVQITVKALQYDNNFELLTPLEEQKPKVELVVTTHGRPLRSNESLVVTIDPEYSDLIESLEESLESILGHSNFVVLPIPKDAIRFYSVEHHLVVGQTDLGVQNVGN